MNFTIDNADSRYKCGIVSILFLTCFSSTALSQTVDDAWSASSTATDTVSSQPLRAAVAGVTQQAGDTFETMDTSTLTPGVTYTNNTGKPMMLTARGYLSYDGTWTMYIYVSGAMVSEFGRGRGAAEAWAASGSAMIPPGSTYMINRSPGNLQFSTTRWY